MYKYTYVRNYACTLVQIKAILTEWKKSGEYKSVLDIITKKNGLTLKDVMDPKPVQPEDIESLTAAAGCIFAAIDCETPIYIVGDYDADGVTSTAILTMTLRAFGGNVQTIIPRRMTDGYGISHDLIKSIRDSFIITVDNGIAANEVIKAAKEEQGNTVVVIDHHLPQGDVPCADVVIDPHVHLQARVLHDCRNGRMPVRSTDG